MLGRASTFAQGASSLASKVRKPKSELKRQLDEATGGENWHVSNSILQNIAQATNEEEDCAQIFAHVWDVLAKHSGHTKDKEWRRVQKTLTLLEAIMKFGSDSALSEIRKDLWRVQQWREHRVYENGKEVGGGIRMKAHSIVDMCGDAELLQAERDKAREISAKIGGHGVSIEKEQKKRVEFPEGFKPTQLAGKARQAQQAVRSRWQKDDGGASGPGSFGGAPPTESEKEQMVSSFAAVTGASAVEARKWLERFGWDANAATDQYYHEPGRAGVFAQPRPGHTELKRLQQRVMDATKCTEKDAMEALEANGWSADLAVAKIVAQRGGQDNSDSDSSSSSGSSSSSDSENEAPKRQAPAPAAGGFPNGGGGFGGGGGGGGWPGAAPKAGGFGSAPFGGPPAGGGFGAPRPAPAFGQQGGGFGGGQPNPFGGGGGGGFGGGGAAGGFGGGGGGFGGQGGAAPNPFGGGGGGGFGGGGGGFGAPRPAAGGFGNPPAGGGFGGARPAANPFGGGGGGGFGAPQGGGFGGGWPS